MVAPNRKPIGSSSNSNEESGNVRVVARIRPLSESESTRGSKETVTHMSHQVGDENKPGLVQVQTTEKRWFELDAVFGKESTQVDVYRESGAQQAVCENLFKGFNCTILAYGQTGAGKTFTMGTASAHAGDITESDGIIPRTCADLFATIQEKCDGNAKVELSYLELYNEEIRDLFAPTPQNSKPTPLKIRETLNGEVYVAGVVEKQVNSPQEIGKLMEEASQKRVVASTAMNAVSSRSHAICTLRIQGILEGPEGTDKFQSKLTLVDLAGSERIKKTGAQGARQTEGININKSLLVLGQVVSALSESGKRRRKPPYRDSKLTRLLQDSLGGNSRTIMVACVSPADFNVDESINTLRYATSARNIKNKATRNLVKNISPEEAAKLQRENQLLKNQVAELQKMLQAVSSSPTSRTPSIVSSLCGSSMDEDDEDVEDTKSTDSKPIPTQIAMQDNTNAVSKMEKEIDSLKKQLKAAKAEAKKAIQVPDLHLEISQLKEQLAESEQIAQENVELQHKLSEAEQDAESARMAATYLSDIVDSLKEIKRDEVDRKVQSLEQMEKEQHWIAFVHVMLENYRMQIHDLSRQFEKKVVQAIESLEFKEDQDALLRKAVQQKKKKPKMSFWKDKDGKHDDESLPWMESTIYFKTLISQIEDSIQFEAESLKDIQRSLEKETSSLASEIGKERLQYESMDDGGKDNALVIQLTSMLLGPRAAVVPDTEEEEEEESSSMISSEKCRALRETRGKEEIAIDGNRIHLQVDADVPAKQ